VNEQGNISVLLYDPEGEVFPNVPLEPFQPHQTQEMQGARSCLSRTSPWVGRVSHAASAADAGGYWFAKPLMHRTRPAGKIWTCVKCSQLGTGQWLGHELLLEQTSSQASGWVRSIHSHYQPGQNGQCLGCHRLLSHNQYESLLHLIRKSN